MNWRVPRPEAAGYEFVSDMPSPMRPFMDVATPWHPAAVDALCRDALMDEAEDRRRALDERCAELANPDDGRELLAAVAQAAQVGERRGYTSGMNRGIAIGALTGAFVVATLGWLWLAFEPLLMALLRS